MSAPIQIAPSEYQRLIRGAKEPDSGVILIETPDAAKNTGMAMLCAHEESSADPIMMALVEDLSRGAAATVVAEARLIRDTLSYRSADSLRLLDTLRNAIESGAGGSTIIVRFPDIASLDPFSALLIRRILDHSDGIAMAFLLPYTLSAGDEDEPPDARLRHVYQLLDLCVKIRMWNRVAIVLEEILKYLPRITDVALRGLIAFRAGMARVRQNRSEEAAGFYEQAIVHLAAVGDQETLVKALNNLGNIRLRARRFEEADGCFSRALELGEELQSDYHLSVSYGNYASLLLQKGQPAHALANAGKSLVFTARSGYYHHTQYSYALIGDCLARLDRDADAVEAYRKALRICELQGNMRDHADCLVRLARVHILGGRRDAASSALDDAEGMLDRLRHWPGLVEVQAARVELHLAAGDRVEAARLAATAEERARALKDPVLIERVVAIRERTVTA